MPQFDAVAGTGQGRGQGFAACKEGWAEQLSQQLSGMPLAVGTVATVGVVGAFRTAGVHQLAQNVDVIQLAQPSWSSRGSWASRQGGWSGCSEPPPPPIFQRAWTGGLLGRGPLVWCLYATRSVTHGGAPMSWRV